MRRWTTLALAVSLAACPGNPAPDGGLQDAGPCSGCELVGCVIGGQSFAAGAANPDSGCQVCSPRASRVGWTDVLDGTACDAGAVCASGSCLPGCFLGGFYRPPAAVDPDYGCLSCQPGASGVEWTPVADGTPCANDGGTFCLNATCLPLCEVGGAIVGDGVRDGGNPDVCCDAATDPTGWSPAFVAGTPIGTAIEPSALAVVTTDAGDVELAVAHPGLSDVGVLSGDGDGGFRNEALFTVGAGPCALAWGDFNGDSRPDLAVVNGGSATIDVLLALADGGFGKPGAALLPLGPGPTAIAVTDLNADGALDLVVADQGRPDGGTNEVSVFLGNGDGTFHLPTAFAVGPEPVALFVADFTGDGIPDLATANAGDSTLSVLAGTDGGFVEPAIATPALAAVPLALASADFDGDGLPDLAVAAESSDGGVLVILTNLGAAPWFGVPMALAAGRAVTSVAAADLDGDGQPDLSAVDQGTASVLVYLNQTLDAGPRFAAPASYPAGRSPTSLLAIPLTDGGSPDLAVADTGGAAIWLLLDACP